MQGRRRKNAVVSPELETQEVRGQQEILASGEESTVMQLQIDYRTVVMETSSNSAKNMEVNDIIFYQLEFPSGHHLRKDLISMENELLRTLKLKFKNAIQGMLNKLGSDHSVVYRPDSKILEGEQGLNYENIKRINEIRRKLRVTFLRDVHDTNQSFNAILFSKAGSSIYTAGDKAKKVRHSIVGTLESFGFSVFDNDIYSAEPDEVIQNLAPKYKASWDKLTNSQQSIVIKMVDYMITKMYRPDEKSNQREDFEEKYKSLGYSGYVSKDRIRNLRDIYISRIGSMGYDDIIAKLLLIRHVEQEELIDHLNRNVKSFEGNENSILIHDPNDVKINLANKFASEFIPASEIVYKEFTEKVFGAEVERKLNNVFGSQAESEVESGIDLNNILQKLYDNYRVVFMSPFEFIHREGANFIIFEVGGESPKRSFLIPVILCQEDNMQSDVAKQNVALSGSLRVVKSVSLTDEFLRSRKTNSSLSREDHLLDEIEDTIAQSGNICLLVAFVIPVSYAEVYSGILGKNVKKYVVKGSDINKVLQFYYNSGAKTLRTTLNLIAELVTEEVKLLQELNVSFDDNGYYEIKTMHDEVNFILFDNIVPFTEGLQGIKDLPDHYNVSKS